MGEDEEGEDERSERDGEGEREVGVEDVESGSGSEARFW